MTNIFTLLFVLLISVEYTKLSASTVPTHAQQEQTATDPPPSQEEEKEINP